MRIRGFLGAAALWLLSSVPVPALAKKDEPSISKTEFPSLPILLQYFPDSDVVIYQSDKSDDYRLYRSDDAGDKWHKIKGIPEGRTWFIRHEFDPKRAYILTGKLNHFRTDDMGETWHEFFVDALISEFRSASQILSFHADNPDYVIYNGMDCEGMFCGELAMYTTDGFDTDAKLMRANSRGCWWAKSSPTFSTADDDLDRDRALCIVAGAFSAFKSDQRLLISDNFFSAESANGVIQEFEPNVDMDRPITGVVNIAFVHGYLLVATGSMNTAEMGLYISDDTLKWHRAMFHGGHRIDQEAYTVLESTEYSIQIDVLNTRPSQPMGVLFTSNSNGTYFTRNVEHTNRNTDNHVDFEKISGIQGIFLVNTVDNWEDVEHWSEGDGDDPKKKVTEITFDDGRSFHHITADGERLHLHSVTELTNIGRVFSSPAPGLVMGIGNTGDYLEKYLTGKNTALYVSDDAGATWFKGLEGPHKYEFGDQGSILVAIHDSDTGDVGEFKYSLNHGKDWQAQELPDGLKVLPWILTTTQDSTSLKFILVGENTEGNYLLAIDFDGLHERKCKDGDMEDWWARVDDDGNPTCVMGQKQKYSRRKKDADCFIMSEFKDPVPETEACDCTDADFECDYNFDLNDDDGKCVAAGPLAVGDDDCKDGAETFMGSSGWRKIPGNACKRRKDEKDELIERKCSDSHAAPKTPGSGKVETGHTTVFKGDFIGSRVWYLERGDSSVEDDETIITRPVGRGGEYSGGIHITHDHGKTWESPKALNQDDTQISDVIPHKHFKDMVFFLPKDGKSVIYTTDRGFSFHTFTPPTEEGGYLTFHPDKMDWIIWVGLVCDNPADETKCRNIASLSTDRGDHWETIARSVIRCEFTGLSAYKYPERDERQIFCLTYVNEGTQGPKQIQGSNDFFKSELEPVKKVSNFATMAEFIVVALRDEENETLHAKASLDGVTFAEAQFPYNFPIHHQSVYTVLDSSTHAINLFVVTGVDKGQEYGAILKSNSNGTSYVLSAPYVNCDGDYYVDFEKMLGLEGVVLINSVANIDELNKNKDKDEKVPKKIQSKISHNDGAQWAFLAPPERDAEGKKYACRSKMGDEKCALHIHSYTERMDRHKTFSSESAIGLMFAVGNVGPLLGDKKDADTFMTRDGGLTWENVMKGEWMWQFGDQGSLIVLAQVGKKARNIKFTVDEGKTWQDYEFAEEELIITDVTTLASGSSRNFIVWGIRDGDAVATNVDFAGLADRDCEIVEGSKTSDYYLWSPRHPLMKDDCLFGHQSQYYRKKPDRNCFNKYRLQHKYNERVCACERTDFECDFNFQLDAFGACHLVPGFEPMTMDQFCTTNPDAVSFYPPTGYRRIPLTTCEKGREMDHQSSPRPCPGKESEFEKAHAVSGWAIFFAVVIPVGLAGAAGYWVWRNWSGKIGQIRLGDGGRNTRISFLAMDADAPWVRYPVMVVAGVVAVVVAIPAVVGAVWRSGRAVLERWGVLEAGYEGLGGGGRRFTSRDSFARGRGVYEGGDEGELLGESSDEDAGDEDGGVNGRV